MYVFRAGIDSSWPNKQSLRGRFSIFSVFRSFFDKNFQKFQNLRVFEGGFWEKWKFFFKKRVLDRKYYPFLRGLQLIPPKVALRTYSKVCIKIQSSYKYNRLRQSRHLDMWKLSRTLPRHCWHDRSQEDIMQDPVYLLLWFFSISYFIKGW